MSKLKQKAVVALVGGSDRMKMQEQMGGDDGEGTTQHHLCHVRTHQGLLSGNPGTRILLDTLRYLAV